MATNPMQQAVMLFQHHQTTTPFMPVPSVPTGIPASAALPVGAAKPKTEKQLEDPLSDTEEENEEDEKNDEEEGEKNG